jgi:hypothetical protein
MSFARGVSHQSSTRRCADAAGGHFGIRRTRRDQLEDNQPITVVLDFMNSLKADRRPIRRVLVEGS